MINKLTLLRYKVCQAVQISCKSRLHSAKYKFCCAWAIFLKWVLQQCSHQFQWQRLKSRTAMAQTRLFACRGISQWNGFPHLFALPSSMIVFHHNVIFPSRKILPFNLWSLALSHIWMGYAVKSAKEMDKYNNSINSMTGYRSRYTELIALQRLYINLQ